MGVAIGGVVERVNGKDLSYREFVERYLKGNLPVVLTGLMDDWRACRDWVTPDGLPDLAFFSDHFGNSIVQAADCDRREFTDQKRLEMSVSEFVKHWLELRATKCSNDLYCKTDTRSLLYLKDWHFNKEYPEYVAYTTPPFFIDDWLNIYLDNHHMHRDSDIHHDKQEVNCSDYRFVYMGAKGTWTPLHADVFSSYSWSANVCGKKLWLFLPPSQCHLIFDGNLKTSVYDVNEEISESRFPGFKKTAWLECTQERNEIIFVPSGWYHQVLNLEDTISINHNWFNAYNLSWVWKLLLNDYNVAKEYIEDIREICDDFESLCQRNLAVNTGMNFYDFFIFLTRFALANLTVLYHLGDEENSVSEPSDKAHHLIVNLMSIRTVASSMKSVEAFSEENINRCSEENRTAYSDLERILEEPEFLELCAALITTYEVIEGPGHDSKISGGPENLVTEVYGSKIQCPGDLVRLIDCFISKHNYISRSCNLFLPPVVCDNETLTS